MAKSLVSMARLLGRALIVPRAARSGKSIVLIRTITYSLRHHGRAARAAADARGHRPPRQLLARRARAAPDAAGREHAGAPARAWPRPAPAGARGQARVSHARGRGVAGARGAR